VSTTPAKNWPPVSLKPVANGPTVTLKPAINIVDSFIHTVKELAPVSPIPVTACICTGKTCKKPTKNCM
jgi:hypothetical protein